MSLEVIQKTKIKMKNFRDESEKILIIAEYQFTHRLTHTYTHTNQF